MNEKSLIRQAYEQILQRILNREYLPGQLLNRRDVAADLDMSMTPVREAMVQLEAEGLMETLPRRGTRIRMVRVEQVRDQLILRMALECQAARLYCGQSVRENESQLVQLARAVDEADSKSIERMRADIIFHGALVELTHCPPLLQAFDQVMRHSLFIAVNLVLKEEVPIPNQHTDLVKALVVDDGDVAEHLIRAHLIATKEDLYDETKIVKTEYASNKAIWPDHLGIYESRRQAVLGKESG